MIAGFSAAIGVRRLFGLGAALLASGAFADEWETLQTDPITVKVRNRPSSGVKEIWAEGDLSGEVIDIQTALTDVTHFTGYMPYMVEAREILKPEADGATYVYSKLDMPVVSARDFIHKTYLDRDARTDQKGVFACHWFAVPDKIPQRSNVVRLRISEGSWLVTPLAPGKAHAIYKFSVDPGGMIPSVFSNLNNVKGPGETFKSVEQEARRRGAERLADLGRDAGVARH